MERTCRQKFQFSLQHCGLITECRSDVRVYVNFLGKHSLQTNSPATAISVHAQLSPTWFFIILLWFFQVCWAIRCVWPCSWAHTWNGFRWASTWDVSPSRTQSFSSLWCFFGWITFGKELDLSGEWLRTRPPLQGFPHNQQLRPVCRGVVRRLLMVDRARK